MKNNKIYYENLSNSNYFFTKIFKKKYDQFIKKGNYILSSNNKNFEKNFSAYIGMKYCIGVANGLDALTISFKSLNLPKNSEVIIASNAYVACIISVINAQLKPVLVEPNIQTYNLDHEKIKKNITKKTKAILAVHMYGKPCNMKEIKIICKKYDLFLIEDCAQSHGASFQNKLTGSFGDLSCFSFYPTKNLGCLGDGGAILCNNKSLAIKLKMMRNYGSKIKNYNDILGQNSRLDEFQASFLNIKLKYLDKINSHKISLAKIYNENLNDKFIKPTIEKNEKHVFHIYNIRHLERNRLKSYLEKNNIKTEIHYPISPSKQKAFNNMFKKKYPISEEIHATTLSLPISYSHTKKDILQVIKVLNRF
ncbi:DegT/DnrJ/EryC1/StrS family aminotransferase [Candidatus Pelagibacter ubique]|nr:DegT/DnrJ/EryC1/StrS family aminotransferase [Candidatus Pelagibacter ubique]